VGLGSDPVRGAVQTGAALADLTHPSNGISDAITHRGHARRRLAPWQR